MKLNQNNWTCEQPRTARHPIWLGCLSLCLAVLWVGCNPEAKVGAGTSLAGTYTLVSVDGSKVPCAVKHEAGGLTVKSGTFIINTDSTCSSKVSFTTPAGTDASREVKATFTREGSKLVMKWEGAGMTSGKVEGNTFTMDNEGMVFVYRK